MITDTLFVDAHVDPLLAEIPADFSLDLAGPSHPARPALEAFVAGVFLRAYGARLDRFYANLLAFSIGGQLQAVVGGRGAQSTRLFAEQYFDEPAQALASARLGHAVSRSSIAEVGNLAIVSPGQARLIIAASTAFMAAAGYRWVLFTAIRPLANAFARLGLRPMVLADADPRRLPDDGASWGTYYQASPKVYLGDIQAGYRKLCGGSVRQPHLKSLLQSASTLGTGARLDDCAWAPPVAGARS
ncbi:MAG: thermostable hemolysin [Betaproteobacteria bacterium]|nr:thermostable hemolysin [Betaproteobacteria bacterium]